MPPDEDDGLASAHMEEKHMPFPLLPILIAVPVIGAFVVFVLLPRLREREGEQRRR